MTEHADPRYAALDRWDSATALAAMWEGQLAAVAAIGPALPAMARFVEAAAARLRGTQGRLIYAGAGASIRLGVQDGVELGPTFDWPDSRLLHLIAGGEKALLRSVEAAEDNGADARAQAAAAGVGPDDVLIGIAASGATPFTVAAVAAARAAGALTAGLANNDPCALLDAAEHPLAIVTGAEAVAGSTRMKAGTAQKAALNLISTQIMTLLGGVHDGLMVGMRPQNAKLRRRAQDMVARIAGVDGAAAQAALEAVGWRIRPAVLVARGMTAEAAQAALARAGGVLRAAMAG